MVTQQQSLLRERAQACLSYMEYMLGGKSECGLFFIDWPPEVVAMNIHACLQSHSPRMAAIIVFSAAANARKMCGN